MTTPAAWITLPLVAGLAAGAAGHVPPPLAVAMLVIAWVTATLCLWRRNAVILVLSVASGAACAGLALGSAADSRAASSSLLVWTRQHPDVPVVHLTGVIRGDAALTAHAVLLTVDVRGIEVSGREQPAAGGVRLTVAGALATARVSAWTAGRVFRCDAVLREPVDFRDPGVPSDRVRLARDGIVLLGTVKSAALVDEVAPAGWLDEAAARVRRHVRSTIAADVGRWSMRSAAVVTAILIGDRSGLEADDERRLQEAGTYHVIAISGGNVALLTVLLLLLGRWAGASPRSAAAASIAFVAFYGYLAGLAPSVERATLAGTLVLAARTLDRRGPAMNGLCVTAALAGAASPLTVLDAGFILSFGATAAIVAGAHRIRTWRPAPREQSRLRRVVHQVCTAAVALGVATLCAEIALVPVSARLFGRLSAAGLILNFAAIPLMSIVQTAGLVVVVVHSLSGAIGTGAGWVAHIATAWLLGSAHLVDMAPVLVRDVPPPANWLIAGWYAAAAALTFSVRRPVRRCAIATLAAAAVVILWGPPVTRAVRVPPPADGWTRLVFLDVGQGDATLVWPAGSEPFLVDAGGIPGSSFDLGRRVTLPALWAFGVTRLSSLVLTHGDPDHIGGAPPLLRALAPRVIVEGVPVPTHAPLAALHDAASALHLPWRILHRGDRYHSGAAEIRVLNPEAPDWERRQVRNDDSIVLDVRVGDVSIVLPGDITAAIESQAVAGYERAAIAIVKAPHHGSAGSSSPAFVTATRPDVVVFSAGQRNPFGHPSAAAVSRYEDIGAHVFRTDRDGAIVLDTDGHRVVMWTYEGSGDLVRRATTATLHVPTAKAR